MRRLVLALCLLLPLGVAAQHAEWDRIHLAEMDRRLNELRYEANDAIAADDTDRFRRKVAEMQKVVDETVDRVSPGTSVALKLDMQLAFTLLEEMAFYLRQSRALQETNVFDLQNLSDTGGFVARQERVRQVTDANTQLLDGLAHVTQTIAEFAANSARDPARQARLAQRAEAMMEEKLSPLRTFLEIDRECLLQIDKMLGLLHLHPNGWALGRSGGMRWIDRDVETQFKTMLQTLLLSEERRLTAGRKIRGLAYDYDRANPR